MEDLNLSGSNTFFSARQTKNDVLVVWKVESFSVLKEKMMSPKFDFKGNVWNLQLNPDGDSRAERSGYTGVYLVPSSSFPSKLCFRFFLKDESGRDVQKSIMFERDFTDTAGWGVPKFLRKQDLLDGKLGNLLPGDILTVCCAIKIAGTSDGAMPEKFVLNFEKDSFPCSFRELYNSKFSDVVLRVGEETIKAHKMILFAHSSVFKAMFESDMKESEENAVDLVDMDATVAKAMLRYMYTWEVEGLSDEKTLELYVAADRYILTELKEKCREFVSNHLSSKNVGEIFEVATLHSDDALVKSVMKFFADNVKSIIYTEDWELFSIEKPASSVKLLTYAFKSNDFI